MNLYKNKILLIIVLCLISLNSSMAFDKTIYLPKIPIYIPEESKALMTDSLLNEINNDFLYTIKDNKSESFYTISIENTKNKYKDMTFREFLLMMTSESKNNKISPSADSDPLFLASAGPLFCDNSIIFVLYSFAIAIELSVLLSDTIITS